MNKKSFLLGLHDSLPICVAFAFMFFSFGTMAHTQSYTCMQNIFMSAAIYAAPLQTILLSNPSEFLSLTALSAILVNFRFVFMTASISSHLKNIPNWKLLIALSTLSASSFTVSHTRVKNGLEGIDFFSYFLAVSVTTYLVAIIFTVLGYSVLTKIDTPFLVTLFAFVMPIHFSGLVAKYMPDLKLILAAIFGFLIMPFCLKIFPNAATIVLPLTVAAVFMVYDQFAEDKQ